LRAWAGDHFTSLKPTSLLSFFFCPRTGAMAAAVAGSQQQQQRWGSANAGPRDVM